MSNAGLADAACVLDALAAGTQPDRARVIAGALALDTLAQTAELSRDLQDAAAGLHIIATGDTLDLDEAGRLRVGQFAEAIRHLISDEGTGQMNNHATKDAAPQWKRLAAMWSAEQAEHALVAGYELTAFVVAADPARRWAREIGWEVDGGAKLLDLVAKGNADSFDDAKAQAEAAWKAVRDTASRPDTKTKSRPTPLAR
jgi:hypothetical protein